MKTWTDPEMVVCDGWRNMAFRKLCSLASSALLGIGCLTGLVIVGAGKLEVPNTDFVGFYTGANLVGTPKVYDVEAHLRFHSEQLHVKPRPDLVSPRLPYYSALIRPLCSLPFSQALLLWRCLMISALLIFALTFPIGSRKDALLALLISVPVVLSIRMGQDVALLLPPIALALRAYRKRWPLLAGVILSMCSVRYHFLILLPVAIAVWREWRFLGGLLGGGGLLIAASCLVQGVHWFGDYINVLRQPAINLHREWMVGLTGITAPLPYGPGIMAALGGMAVFAAWRVSVRYGFEVGTAACLVAGIFVSPHAYLHDAAILIPALLIVAGHVPHLRGLAWAQMLPVYPCLGFVLALPLFGRHPILDVMLSHFSPYFVTIMMAYLLAKLAFGRISSVSEMSHSARGIRAAAT